MTATMTPPDAGELALFRESARAFFQREVVPHQERWAEQHHVDRELWQAAGEAGMLCAGIPEELGGGGGSFAHEAVVLEEQARALDTAFGNQVHSAICAHYVLACGTPEQQRRWLPGMGSGELVAAVAMTEPGAGSDLKAVRTTARRDGDAYVLDGTKTFISNGLHADLVIVVAKTDPAAGAHGISLFVLETADAPGFTRGRLLDKLGMRGQDTIELFFEDVRVPAENLLGGVENRGFAQLMEQLPRERLTLAVQSVATAERILEDTVAYVKEREAFGADLFALQNTRFELAECATEVRLGRTFVDDCVARIDAGTLDSATASMAKWWCSDMQGRVIDRCLQLHGGYGFMLEYPVARAYADARVTRIFGGANEVMKELIARSL
jgi:acyl-CoA dehydrogenase